MNWLIKLRLIVLIALLSGISGCAILEAMTQENDCQLPDVPVLPLVVDDKVTLELEHIEMLLNYFDRVEYCK